MHAPLVAQAGSQTNHQYFGDSFAVTLNGAKRFEFSFFRFCCPILVWCVPVLLIFTAGVAAGAVVAAAASGFRARFHTQSRTSILMQCQSDNGILHFALTLAAAAAPAAASKCALGFGHFSSNGAKGLLLVFVIGSLVAIGLPPLVAFGLLLRLGGCLCCRCCWCPHSVRHTKAGSQC